MTAWGVTNQTHANAESGLLTAACGLHHASLSGHSEATEQVLKVAPAPCAGGSRISTAEEENQSRTFRHDDLGSSREQAACEKTCGEARQRNLRRLRSRRWVGWEPGRVSERIMRVSVDPFCQVMPSSFFFKK